VGSDIIIAHEEYIQDIFPTTGFAINTFINNPGNPVLMPWMSQIASLYEEFELLGMVYCYKSTCAQVAATSTNMGLGTVVIATDYDCLDTNFANKRAMEAAEFSTSSSPLEHQCHPIECDPKRSVLATHYVAPGIANVAAVAGDARFSVPSVTTVGTVNMPTSTGTAIGELWCSYHVRCSRPVLEGITGTFSQHIAFTTKQSTNVVNNIRNTLIGGLGFTFATYGTASIGGLVLQATAPGRYVIVINSNFSNVTTATFTPSTTLPFVGGSASYPPVLGGPGGLFDQLPCAVDAAALSTTTVGSTGNCHLGTFVVQFGAVGDTWTWTWPNMTDATQTAIHDIMITNLPLGYTSRRGKSTQQMIDEALRANVSKLDNGEVSPLIVLPHKHLDYSPSTKHCPPFAVTRKSSSHSFSKCEAITEEPTVDADAEYYQDEGSDTEELARDVTTSASTSAGATLTANEQLELTRLLRRVHTQPQSTVPTSKT
jgi:hypothetical protein